MKALAYALLAALFTLLALPAVAGAHATVISTSPPDRAVLKSAPRTVQMRFSEPVDLGPGSLRLLDATGKEIKTADARHAGGDRQSAVLPLPSGLADGTYVVAWRVTSADSHPVSGAFSFSIGAPSSFVTALEPGESGTAVKVVDGIARGVAFAGFALAIGGACVLLLLWPQGAASRRGRRLVWTGIGALAGGTFALLLLQGPYAGGGALLDAFKPSLLSFSVSTRFGQALIARLVLTLVFALLVARALRGERPHAVLLGLCAVGLVATWTFTDHSRTGVQPWLGIPAASAHMLAMALWFGGLVMLAVSVLARDVQATLEPVVPRFSRLALACFAVLGVTGVYLAWRQAGELAALPATHFGRLLLIKSAIVLVIVGLAALSRRAVHRAGGDLARRLRRTVVAEVVLGVVVLGVTAALVNAAPARVSYAPPLDVSVPSGDGGQVQVHMEPAKQGENVTDVYLVAPGGRLLIPPEVTARLLPPEGKDLGPLPVELGSAEPGHYVAPHLTVPFPGRWTLRLNVRTSDIDERTIDVPVRIR